jgi:hypothetical protein
MVEFASETTLDIDNQYYGQEPFVNIPEETIREALKVLLGIIRT